MFGTAIKTAMKIFSKHRSGSSQQTEATATPTGPLSEEGIKTPLRPRLVVRVGVTGHRSDLKLTQGADQDLRKVVEEVLTEIQTFSQEIVESQTGSGFSAYSDVSPCMRLISPIAEGADQLVANVALGLNWELHCPLPFPAAEYESDFKSPDTRNEFVRLLGKAHRILELDGPADAKNRHKAYEMVGRIMLRHCDILIAIWDNERPGAAGGTAQIVREALAHEIPVIWVHPHIQWPACLLSLAKSGEDPGVRKDLSLLRKRIFHIFQFPESEDGQKAAQRFFREKQPRLNHGLFFKLFCKFWVWHWKLPRFLVRNFQAMTQNEWEKTWKILSLAEQKDLAKKRIVRPLEAGFLRPFAWADGLAEFYADKYRSSFTSVYLLGALAILFAYLGSRPDAPPIFSWIELGLIVLIIGLTAWGRWKHWHERWIDYRALAEELRQEQFLSLLGHVTTSFKVPTHLEASNPRGKWFTWYFKAISRQSGLIQATLNNSYLDSYRLVLERWIESQTTYHNRRADHHRRLHRHLHFAASALFVLTLASCLLHLFVHIDEFEPYFTFGTVVFPAFAGALGAILHVGEFDNVARRSDALKSHLEGLACQLRCIGETATSRDLGLLAENLSDVALSELVDWRFTFLEKDLELPA